MSVEFKEIAAEQKGRGREVPLFFVLRKTEDE
jgi:hypothetical protein